jgi:hypothetical protein
MNPVEPVIRLNLITRRLRPVGLVALLALTACAARLAFYNDMKAFMRAGDYAKADALIEQSKKTQYGEKNALLYWFDKGIVAHYAGRYEESIAAFDRADKLGDELFTKSVTQAAASFILSDNTMDYAGEDFERVAVHQFQAVNYLMLGKMEGALVEARRINHKLKTLVVNYGGKYTYHADAFAEYLTGLLYEAGDQYNSAFVSLRNAANIYAEQIKLYTFPTPPDLMDRTLRMARVMGFRQEFDDLSRVFNLKMNWKDAAPDRSRGELVVIHYNGFAPYKIEESIEIAFKDGWAYVTATQAQTEDERKMEQAREMARAISADEQFKVAFPKFVPSPTVIARARLTVSSETQQVASLITHKAQDIETIAVRNLEDRIAAIRTKAIARAAIRYALQKAVERELLKEAKSELAREIIRKSLQAAATAAEQADVRSWRTLPREINLGFAALAPGIYTLSVDYTDAGGTLITREVIRGVEIRAGRKTFIPLRSSM